MNMNCEGFEKSCLELGIWGEEAADVYGGEDCMEYVAAKCGMQKEELSASLLRMQLEQERYFRFKSAGRAPESPKEARLAAGRDVLRNLQERFAHCPREERQGVFLHMLEEVLELKGHSVTEEERARLARMSAERLESWLAAEITRCAEMLFAENQGEAGHMGGAFFDGERVRETGGGLSDGEKTGETGGGLFDGEKTGETGGGLFDEEKNRIWEEPSLAGAVTSVAAFVHCPEFRGMPELITDACAGAVFAAEAEHGGSDEEFFSMIVYIMLLEAALLLTCLLVPASPGAACALLIGSGLTMAGARAFFLQYMEIFSVSLEMAIGGERAQLAQKGAAYLARLSAEENLTGNAEGEDVVLSWLEEPQREPTEGEESEDNEENMENEEEQDGLLFGERT